MSSKRVLKFGPQKPHKSLVRFYTASEIPRVVDRLGNDGIANQANTDYTSLRDPTIAQEISADTELLNEGQVNSVIWHFFRSAKTGQASASGPLLKALHDVRFNVVNHYR